jgi:MFS family permease
MGMAAVNVAIPSMANDLLADANKVGWLPTIYLLSNVAFMLPVGKLADNFGRKRVYMAGLLLNAVAAIMCGVASSIDIILFWRFVQGLAAAMIFGTGIAIVTSVVPSNKRGSALGIVAACVYIGLTIAPAIGGYLTEVFSWRAVFYFQVPPVLALIVFMFVAIKGEWKNQEKTRFDFVGTGLFALFASCFVYGMSKLPSAFGMVITALSLLSLLVFLIHQSKSSRPLIRLQMFSESRVFSLSLASSFFMYGSNFAIIFLLSLYLQYIYGTFSACGRKAIGSFPASHSGKCRLRDCCDGLCCIKSIKPRHKRVASWGVFAINRHGFWIVFDA